MRSTKNMIFKLGQSVQFVAPSTGHVVVGTFNSYGGYKHNEAGETIATTGNVYMGRRWVATLPLDKITPINEVASEV